MMARDQVLSLLEAYRLKVKNHLNGVDHRLVILEIIRLVDYEEFLKYIYCNGRKKRPDEDWEKEMAERSRWGLNEALSLLWNDDSFRPGIPLFSSNKDTSSLALALLLASKNIRLVEFCLEMDRVGLGDFLKDEVHPNRYCFFLKENAIGAESVERDDESYLISRSWDAAAWARINRKKASVLERMSDLVSVWNKHYIKYGALPEIDEFYRDVSDLLIKRMSGSDAFSEEALFGGIVFGDYIKCIKILIGFSLKHLDFCVILSNEFTDEIKPVNIVAYPCLFADAALYLGEAMGVDKVKAEKLLLATTLNPENISYHLGLQSGPLAPHYMVADGSVIRSIRGCLENPCHFVLRELRRLYPDEWNSYVDAREDVFRKEIKDLFGVHEQIEFLGRGLQIESPIGKTDIDAVAFDANSGEIALIQLKWQDPFGSIMRERESRKRNFLNKANEWVEKVVSWRASVDVAQRLRDAGMSKAVLNHQEIYLIVIGRSYSYFSGDFVQDSRAAWGNWAQVVRLFEGNRDATCPIGDLWRDLIADSPKNRSKRPTKRNLIKVGDFELEVIPYDG